MDELHSYNRFKTVHPGWGYGASYWNAITWRPNKSILVAGFGVYKCSNVQSNFFVKYKYTVSGEISKEYDVEVVNVDIDDVSRIYPLMFDGNLVDVPAGTDLTI